MVPAGELLCGHHVITGIQHADKGRTYRRSHPHVVGEAHQRVELVGGHWHPEGIIEPVDGLLRVLDEPLIGLELSASCRDIPSMAPADAPDAPLVLVGRQLAVLEALDKGGASGA